jgi:plastocyanin
MAYQWWLFAHLAGVFGFLTSHGVSVAVGLRLRGERDAAKINALLDISGRTALPSYISLALLVVGGVGATFAGNLWSFGWIWAAIVTLVVVSGAMLGMARPYYQRVRFISRAVAQGSQAVSAEQFDSVLSDRRPLTVMWIGGVGLVLLLYLMIFKPTLGMSPASEPPAALPTGPAVEVASTNSRFVPASLSAPASTPFEIRFRNNDSGVPHNVALYSDSSAAQMLFRSATFAGPATRVFGVRGLRAGTYFLRCDLHATTMTGTFEAL